jgi:hypothetical protein
MTFGYVQPFSIHIGSRPETKVTKTRHGVTEITLNDGRMVRATLHVKAVKDDLSKPGKVDIYYNVTAEVMNTPSGPILPVHETLQ